MSEPSNDSSELLNESPPDDVTKILSLEDIGKIRAGYDEAYMNESADAAAIRPFPFMKDIIKSFGALFYGPSALLAPDMREAAVISLLTARDPGGLFVAIHCYWGLCVGLSPERLGALIGLTGMYGGLEAYTGGIATLEVTLEALKGLTARGPTVSSKDAVNALVAVWRCPLKAATAAVISSSGT